MDREQYILGIVDCCEYINDPQRIKEMLTSLRDRQYLDDSEYELLWSKWSQEE